MTGGGARGAAAALSFEDVSFAYAGGAPVLEHVDWTVPEGAFALLVGATGSGKSTLLSLAKPEIAPAGELRGRIEVGGVPVGELDAAASARSVGYVFQDPEAQIVCESVWHEMAFGLENLGVPRDEMRRLVAETSYFFGIDDWFHEDTATLSGGRKQVLALASTLVLQPRLLLLDEPTAMLDPVAERNFLHALFRVNRELGCTVVMATHRPRAMVDYATCAFEVADGRVREVADLDALRARPGLIEPEPSAPPMGAAVPRAAAGTGGASATATPAGEVAASLEGAWLRYGRRGAWVLRGLDLEIRRGEVHAIVGGNGCGKSTALGALAGTIAVQRGRARATVAPRALLPQDPRALLVADTVGEELMEWSRPGGYGEADARAMLSRLGLGGLADRSPYDLSGGQRQLLALGKLLLIRPALLMLDEPTKGLDLAAWRLVARLVRGLAREGAAVAMATHDLDFASQVADRVSMVFDGEAACTQPTREFFRGNVYYRP